MSTIPVVHCLPSCLRNHGPSSGMTAQIAAQDPRYRATVWSMYPPPADRDPTAQLAAVHATHQALGLGRSILDPRAVPVLAAALRRAAPVVFQGHLLRANLMGRLAAKLAGVPVVINTLRSVEEYMTRDDLMSRLVRQAERATAGLAHRYVAVSERVRQAAITQLGYPAERVVTILNAVDLRPFEQPADARASRRAAWGVPETAVLLGTVGVLEPRKNHEMLVRTLARLQASPAAPVHLVVVGDGESEAAIRAEAQRAGVADRVHLPGFDAKVPEVLSALDLFLLGSFTEGLPRAVMEAMASGLACVVTDAGGTAEAVRVGETGFVHDVQDETGFAASVQQLLDEPARRHAMGAAGRRHAFAAFTPARQGAAYDALYREALDEVARSPAATATAARRALTLLTA